MTDYGTDISQHAESVEILERKNVRMILQNFVATHSTKTIDGKIRMNSDQPDNFCRISLLFKISEGGRGYIHK